MNLVAAKLKSVRRAKGGKAIFGLASSALSNEELFFFRDLMTKGCTAEHVGSLDGTHFKAVAKAWEMRANAHAGDGAAAQRGFMDDDSESRIASFSWGRIPMRRNLSSRL